MSAVRVLSVIFGLAFLAAGIAGYVPSLVPGGNLFGYFEVDSMHNVVHILSGVIAGLIAQGIPLGDAATLGVCLHAMAGDLAAKEGERGTIATDLLTYLHRLVNTPA